MTKKIIFTAKDKTGYEVQNKPIPASTKVPKWWREMVPYTSSPENPEGKFALKHRVSNASFKKCTPMLDSITSGYLLTLHADVLVEQSPEGPYISWRVRGDIFQPHGRNSQLIPPPAGYSNHVFKYLNTWIPKTPPGYSIMVTPPAGHYNQAFQAIPAIIDSDKSTLELLTPMWVKEGFEGIVEKGTPLVQLTPFKRESWESEFKYYEENEYNNIEDTNFNATLINHYIKNHWSKKTYK